MDDEKIVGLYFQRSEDAIRTTHAAYGARLHRLAESILDSGADAEECVSDTYLKAWESIPPHSPVHLYAYLAKICRCLCFDRLDRRNAAKRSANIVALTAEMEQCIPDRMAESSVENQLLGALLNRFLSQLPKLSRVIFVRRYWYGDSVEDIALRYSLGQSMVKTRLHRTRNQLRKFLEKEGITL